MTNFLTHPSPHRTFPLNRLIQSLHNNPVIKNFEIDIKPHLITKHITRNNSKTSSLFFFAKGGAKGSPKKTLITAPWLHTHHVIQPTKRLGNSIPPPHIWVELFTIAQPLPCLSRPRHFSYWRCSHSSSLRPASTAVFPRL